ncbi:MAG: peptidoglycan DD-metalloendopeptidase family protein [Reichenbachiella sp.]
MTLISLRNIRVRHISLILVATLLLVFTNVEAQKSKTQLEKEKKENLAKINEAQKTLNATKSEKKSSLGQLKAINRQIDIRQSLINSINKEIKIIGVDVSELTMITTSLESDLEKLKQEYAEMIYNSYKANHGYNKITFLFSAKTFNQLYLRLKYLEQYADARKVQVEQIGKVRDALNDQKSTLITKKEEQSTLLEDKIKENKNLLSLKSKQNKLVQDLSKREKELKREMAERKKSVQKLDNLIANIVRKEIEKSNANKTSNTIALNEAGTKLSASFEGNKNKLPWPVSTGFVSEKFGKHPHPVLKSIMVENQGIDIQTQKDATVNVIFDGEVATTAFVPGMNSVVIVKHGDYYTLYAKLKTVNVKKGQKLLAKQNIGTVFTDGDDISELQFQVWKNNVKLDPEKWLNTK